MKKIIIGLILLFLTVGCGCNNKKETTKKDDLGFDANFNITDNVNIDGLLITDVQLIIKNETSNYSAVVTNKTDDLYKLETISIILKDKNGNIIEELSGYIGSDIAVDSSRDLFISTDKNLKNAYSIEYKINR